MGDNDIFPLTYLEMFYSFEIYSVTHVCIIELLGHCKGGDFDIQIWTWFGKKGNQLLSIW